jgi:hypothetical protein
MAGTPVAADSSYRSIREAWGRFLGVVSISRARTKSPGEIATHAVEVDGLPPDAVATLRDVFREVEYGGRSPDDRLQRVEVAISDIEAHLETQREEPDHSDTPGNAPVGGAR